MVSYKWKDKDKNLVEESTSLIRLVRYDLIDTQIDSFDQQIAELQSDREKLVAQKAAIKAALKIP